MANNTYSSKYTGAEQDAFFDKLVPLGSNSLATVAKTNSYNDLSDKPDFTTKVDKVSGKQLSTEDYTTAEKTKLSNCKTVWEGTQVEYEALESKTYDLYMIYEEEENQNGD